jgi:aryl-alcohol dehydrogenase-like predicted oxidoreductase
VVGLGASHFGRVCDLLQTRAVVDAALDAGITFIDTAEAYPGSEELLGQTLRSRRAAVVLSSKFGHPHNHPGGPRGTRQVIRTSLERSLQRLRTEYLDVYLMHAPDPQTPLEETLEALRELRAEGLVRYFGLSNHPAAQIASGITCVQERYNLLNRAIESDILPLARRLGIGLVPAAPLASGVLTGRRNDPDVDDRTWTVLAGLREFARSRAISMVQLAIGWLAAQSGVGPIITGATRPEQIVANARAADWQPSQDELEAIDALSVRSVAA